MVTVGGTLTKKLRCMAIALGMIFQPLAAAQEKTASRRRAAAPKTAARNSVQRPKLVVMIVVDQMRADYVDKFRGQWSGGLKRLVEEGAWFRDAAYPYAAKDTCVGHATISTGALPATHGMVANGWWDREQQKSVTCTADTKVKNLAYGGANVTGGDSAWRMQVPSFAEELKFQTGGHTRGVTFSLQARASITMAGHKDVTATWFDGKTGSLETSSAYQTQPFIEDFAKAHPAKEDYGKTWALSLPEKEYFYDAKATGAVAQAGLDLSFPHALRGQSGAAEPDDAFYEQWSASPFADTYLTKLAEAAGDSLRLGTDSGTDYLGVSYSSVDYVGHAFGPRSWEIQDVLVRLDKDLGELLQHLDTKVGRGNYVIALSADHGVVPVPEDMQKTGADAGLLHLPELQARVEKALEPFHFASKPIVTISGSDVYFAPGVYDKLKSDAAAMRAALDAMLAQPGVAEVYRAEELAEGPTGNNRLRNVFAYGYFPGRSGDLLIVPKAYWLMDSTPSGKTRTYGTGHGTPWNYDQHVPVFFMGYGIQAGEYFGAVTPADIAPTLAPRDGRVLSEALKTKVRRITVAPR